MNGNADVECLDLTSYFDPPTSSSDEEPRPGDPGYGSPSVRTSGPSRHNDDNNNNNDESAVQKPPTRLPPGELETVRTKTDPVKDFDALLASLESDDENEQSSEDPIPAVGEARAIPSALLETSPNEGLDDAEVLSRRKRFGWNMMKEEKRSHLKTFLMFFVGPIQCVMLVS